MDVHSDSPEKLERNKIYRGCRRGFSVEMSPMYFVWEGEKRPPKKGEFFLSGSKIQAYEAYDDMSEPYCIAVPCEAPPKSITRNGLVYRLEGPA